MSINDKINSLNAELSRIAQAKSGIANAIIAKGVAVPDGAKIESYPALVEQIKTESTGEEIPVALLLEGNPFGFDGYFYRKREKNALFLNDYPDMFEHDAIRSGEKERVRAEVQFAFDETSNKWCCVCSFIYDGENVSYRAYYQILFSENYNNSDEIIQAYKNRLLSLPFRIGYKDNEEGMTTTQEYGVPEHVMFTLRVGMTAKLTTLIADNPNAIPTFPPQKPESGGDFNSITISGLPDQFLNYNATYTLSSDGTQWESSPDGILHISIYYGSHPGDSSRTAWVLKTNYSNWDNNLLIYSSNSDPRSIVGSNVVCETTDGTQYTAKIEASGSGGGDTGSGSAKITITGADQNEANQTYSLTSGNPDDLTAGKAVFTGDNNTDTSAWTIEFNYIAEADFTEVYINNSLLGGDPEGQYFTNSAAGTTVEKILASSPTWTDMSGTSKLLDVAYSTGGSPSGGGNNSDIIIVSGAGTAEANDTYRRITEGGGADWGQKTNVYYTGIKNGKTLQIVYDGSIDAYTAMIGVNPPYYSTSTTFTSPSGLLTAAWYTVVGASPLPTLVFGD